MKRSPRLVGRVVAATVSAVGLVAGLAACGDDAADDGTVTITVNGLPPETEKANHQKFLADVAEFEKLNPGIKLDVREGKMEPEEFASKLVSGQLEDVFYTYFTDPAGLIADRQVADITPYLEEFPEIQQLRPELLDIYSDADGNVYGLPTQNYSLGLVYNRVLFEEAGLDPDSPPTTWDEVRTTAKAISDLGDDVIGYGEYSRSNTGGWHFTAELYSLGGQVAVHDGDTWRADFDNELGEKLLTQLHEMRWTDASMGKEQGHEYDDLLQLMGSGKLGMYVAAPNNIPPLVQQYEADYADFGLGPMPGGQGTLAGGEGYMFNAAATPEEIRAGLKWLTFAFVNPDRIESNLEWEAEQGNPVGLPEPAIWTGDAEETRLAAIERLANVPQDNYLPFTEAMSTVPIKVEPPNAQQIYAVLDSVMFTVLTKRDADIDELLATAAAEVDAILSTVV